jgi:hypothetical protein
MRGMARRRQVSASTFVLIDRALRWAQIYGLDD